MDKKTAPRPNLIASNSKKVDTLPSCCVRLEINLKDLKGSDGHPEFNYKDFLKIEEKKYVNAELANLYDNEAHYEDDVQRAVKYFETKYQNTNYRWGDIDLGAGYDEEDSFIDNTDAYDEIVPKEITTSLGGFYVNQGKLEFKEVENIEDMIVISDESSNDGSPDEENESDEEVDISEDETPNNFLKRNLIVSLDDNNNTKGQNCSQPLSKKTKYINASFERSKRK